MRRSKTTQRQSNRTNHVSKYFSVGNAPTLLPITTIVLWKNPQ